jgi:hypothetical protein
MSLPSVFFYKMFRPKTPKREKQNSRMALAVETFCETEEIIEDTSKRSKF